MGHYGDLYDADREYQARLRAKRLAKLKAKYPDDPSEWDISIEDRMKLLEDRVLKLEQKRKKKAPAKKTTMNMCEHCGPTRKKTYKEGGTTWCAVCMDANGYPPVDNPTCEPYGDEWKKRRENR